MATTTQHRRIGGVDDLSVFYESHGRRDLVASLVGMFAGLGAMGFITMLAAGVLIELGYELDTTGTFSLNAVAILGLILGAIVVFASFVIGGFAAGRMSRYNGGVHGLGAGLWLVFLVAVFTAIGVWTRNQSDIFDTADLPAWLSQVEGSEPTVLAVAAGVVLMAAILGGGYVGGRLGAAHHTRIDAALVDAARES